MTATPNRGPECLAATADTADIAEKTFYNHFPSKDDLVLAYIEDQDRIGREAVASSGRMPKCASAKSGCTKTSRKRATVRALTVRPIRPTIAAMSTSRPTRPPAPQPPSSQPPSSPRVPSQIPPPTKKTRSYSKGNRQGYIQKFSKQFWHGSMEYFGVAQRYRDKLKGAKLELPAAQLAPFDPGPNSIRTAPRRMYTYESRSAW